MSSASTVSDSAPSEAARICHGQSLIDGGLGTRFPVWQFGGRRWIESCGFVVRFDGVVRGYLNECRHVPSELDWQAGRFFDHEGLYLICATHGALYRPEDGLCIQGPCAGSRLILLEVREHGGDVFWIPDSRFRPVDPTS